MEEAGVWRIIPASFLTFCNDIKINSFDIVEAVFVIDTAPVPSGTLLEKILILD
jgi:hypothetical protein